MKIALLGYGRMGKAIQEIAINRGHEIIAIIDKDKKTGDLAQADVAINFSIPSAAVENIQSAFNLNIPVVCGTTGWLDHLDSIHANCKEKETAFLYASNFSIGVNLFFKLNSLCVQLMKNHRDSYTTEITETHHIHKLDAPSGTAITLAEGILEQNDQFSKWTMDEDSKGLKIRSLREGEVPGTHKITYQSEIDEISIEHKAHSRAGFALGAVIAAEWLNGKQGIYTMNDVLNL
jgi:4-hydroxy-tetrahydrodipicolinate reductase